MSKFIKRALLYPLILFLFYLFYYLYFSPLPSNSNDICYNAKTLWFNNKSISKVEVAVLGSSLSLNNLDAKYLGNQLDCAVINLATWGQRIVDVEAEINNLVQLDSKLKYVIFCVSPGEFTEGGPKIDMNLFRMSYKLLDHLKWIKIRESYNFNSWSKCRYIYQSLDFDDAGSVLLASKEFDYDSNRWNNTEQLLDPLSRLSIKQYNALERIDSCASINDINVILIATPFRTSFLDEELNKSLGNWNSHLDSVVSTYRNIQVLHFQEALWYDSLYVDRNHMNEIGARQLTNKVLLDYDFASLK